jgi:hypothetical protein
VPDSGETVLEAHSAYTMALINPSYLPPDVDPAEAKIRFGCIFPNLIPVLSPSDLTYLRVDPIAHDRLRLFVRSYGLPAGVHTSRLEARIGHFERMWAAAMTL